MAIQKITSSQVAAPSGATLGWVLTSTGAGLTPTFQALPAGSSGALFETKFVSLAGGSADKTFASFAFVVGIIMIEVLFTDSPDANDVHLYAFGNMRSFSGSKTANITNRICKGFGSGSGHTYFQVDRSNSGRDIVISRPNSGTDVNIDGTGLASYTAFNWPNPGLLRVTAIEDTQS
jgi:hypothetical protein